MPGWKVYITKHVVYLRCSSDGIYAIKEGSYDSICCTKSTVVVTPVETEKDNNNNNNKKMKNCKNELLIISQWLLMQI